MPSMKRKSRTIRGKFCAGFAMAMLLIPAAFAGDEDQRAYCKYVTQEAAAQRDLLLTPNAIAGFTQPNTGLPTQVVWGASGSLSNMRKAGLTADEARKNCELYRAAASAQQAIQYAMPSLEKQALQHRLGLIQQASERLDALLGTTSKMLDAQNMTRPMAFAFADHEDQAGGGTCRYTIEDCRHLCAGTERPVGEGIGRRKAEQRSERAAGAEQTEPTE
jgi:hypothetical protein